MSVVMARSGGQPGLSTEEIRGILPWLISLVEESRGEAAIRGRKGGEGLLPRVFRVLGENDAG